ncbi:C40 family peptidase [Paeniglutamicibacter kerguelensis]|uniref:Cell wall-associated NlpC family hydrolase n=1 Tax=Paeniglutamicibacter kerguelensis TaxID=254788 RepID=A0ABS4XKD5_9MICC|nr:C40 family peptidase [Paeniglutamicibacter kerguelensis]MBP2388796.1 cell wall-associated NlpC family hydrolase [Paeniglutamicibacter kerguelensis]
MVFRETLGVTACAIALTVTCLTGAIPATAASASPLSGIMLPFEPGPAESPLPTKAQLQAAKSNPEQLRAMVDQLEATIEQARSRLVNAEALALDAQDGLLAADELLQERARTATEARSEAEKASEYLDSSKKNVGALASDLYRNGGINPGVVNLLDSDDDSDVLYKASTMGALSANRARTVSTAEEAVALWKAWQDYADAAETAANEATAAQLAAAGKASSTMSTYEGSIAPQEKLRSELIDQLAFLRDVDAKEEAARIAAKEEAAESARLQELIDNTPPAPPVRENSSEPADIKPLATPPKVPTERPQGDSLVPKPTKPKPPENIAVVPEPEDPPVKPEPTPEAPKPTPTPEKPKPTPEAPKPKPTPTPEKPKPTPTPTPEKPKPPVDEVVPPSSNSFNAAISWAQVIANDDSKGYKLGANGPDLYDCSSYTGAAFAKSGVYLPRTSSQQYAAAPKKVPLSQLRRGDLVFSSSNGGSSFYHVAIYLGNGQVIHARNPSSGISVTPLSWVNNIHPYAGRY